MDVLHVVENTFFFGLRVVGHFFQGGTFWSSAPRTFHTREKRLFKVKPGDMPETWDGRLRSRKRPTEEEALEARAPILRQRVGAVDAWTVRLRPRPAAHALRDAADAAQPASFAAVHWKQ